MSYSPCLQKKLEYIYIYILYMRETVLSEGSNLSFITVVYPTCVHILLGVHCEPVKTALLLVMVVNIENKSLKRKHRQKCVEL